MGSFAEVDPGLFLSNTWLLIEESNAPLAVAGMYCVQEYRLGLSRMDRFLRANALNNLVFATDYLERHCEGLC